MAEREPGKAERLDQALQDRRSQFQATLQISRPFVGVEAIFPAVKLRTVGNSLIHDNDDEAGGSVVLTNVASRGPVMLEAEFATGWDRGKEIGLLIHSQGEDGYRFLVNRHDEPAGQESLEGWNPAESASRLFRLAIYRNGQKLSQKLVVAKDLEQQPLRLMATIEDNLLTFRVNRKIEVASLEYFPLAPQTASVFGLVWPAEASLLWLLGSRKELPAVPSLLEKADGLYVEGQFEQALVEYRLAAANTANTEAMLKQGVCEIALGRAEEAARLLHEVIRRDTAPHAAFARCQLVGLELQAHRYEAVDQLMRTMLLDSANNRAGALPIATVMPDHIRQQLDLRYGPSGGFEYFRFDPTFASQREIAVELQRQFEIPYIYRSWIVLSWVRAYRAAGNTSLAIRAVEDFLQELPADEPMFRAKFLTEYAWLMRVSVPSAGHRRVGRKRKVYNGQGLRA